MSSRREQQLVEGLKNLFYGVQKSQQIYKELSKWQKKAIRMEEKEVEKAAKKIAATVEKWVVEKETNGDAPAPGDVKKRIAKELEEFAE